MSALFDDLAPSEQVAFLDAVATLLEGMRRRGVRA
jgi:hypothetical protein